jgi:glucan 1,3-beta-glucosidase
MMGQSNVADQCHLEDTLAGRFGASEKERLMKVFRDNWITERDWDTIASFDFNVVRVPFIYSLLEDDAHPFTLRADAWEYLDEAIAQAEARGMYVILDLHGAAGSQGREQLPTTRPVPYGCGSRLPRATRVVVRWPLTDSSTNPGGRMRTPWPRS